MSNTEKNPSFCDCCQSCLLKKLHTPADWLNHPFAGHGYTREWGWTHPGLETKVK